MTKRMLIAVFAVGLMAPLSATFAAATAAAQERTSPAPVPPPPPPAPPAAPGRPAPPDAPPPPPPAPLSPKNVQLDIVITDTISGKPEAKRVTLVLRGNGGSGSIRTTGHVVSADNNAPVELALDGNVRVLSATLVDVGVTFTYAPPPTTGADIAGSSWRMSTAPRVIEVLSVTLHSGRPLLVSRSADPVTNRTVTVELTATVREP